MNQDFFELSPDIILAQCEAALGFELEPNLRAFNSYVNRVYGISAQGKDYIAKFYRPQRHSKAALLDEHTYVQRLAELESPVVAPLMLTSGSSLGAFSNERGDPMYFALYHKRAGRQFDAESGADWLRMGRLIGRMHEASKSIELKNRILCHPSTSTQDQLQYLYDEEVVDREVEADFFDLCDSVLERLGPRFDKARARAIHGDLHRGNILDRLDEGLVLIDFDDCMRGPAVQDLWLMLPGRVDETQTELQSLLEGYQEFSNFDQGELYLIEGLRFMRIVHYLAWCCRQRHDERFISNFPDWGTKSFWIKELEDLITQERFI